MASTPFISHTVNGYSRYEIPENVAFSASAGILYPVRTEFLNARDVRYIQAGATIRTNPALLPTFTPFRVSLHRFFVPMQLYHPEMRVNSSKFDFQTLSTNVFASGIYSMEGPLATDATPSMDKMGKYFTGRSLLAFLGLSMGSRTVVGSSAEPANTTDPFRTSSAQASLVDFPLGKMYVNADPILAYYDIIRSYYSFSQIGTLSFAFPVGSDLVNQAVSLPSPGTTWDINQYVKVGADATSQYIVIGKAGQYWRQAIGQLSTLDDLFESSFYPKRNEARGLYYDRTPDICDAVAMALTPNAPTRDESAIHNVWNCYWVDRAFREIEMRDYPTAEIPIKFIWASKIPFGVAPAVADRFSRMLPIGDTDDVSLTSINTVRGLAFAAKLQAYKDLLSSGGNRFTDWLMTFFAAKVKHVDRPVLVYSSSFYMNSSPIFSQQGGEALGSYAGVMDGNSAFGKKAQRYCFDEPGYLMDIFSIRPLYYWSGIQKDYARYDKMDYFNPIFNEVGYETVPRLAFGSVAETGDTLAAVKQPCYNEFRASYDRVLGDMAMLPGELVISNPLLTTWVQQRARLVYGDQGWRDFDAYLASVYYTDVNQANSVFASTAEDNFFVNIYYNVTSKSLVSKNFATNLATR